MTITDDHGVADLLDVLAAAGHDFRHYARASLLRRVGRALQVLHLHGVPELTRLITTDAEVVGRVVDLLTVQVTEMFRDPSFYRALRDRALSLLETWPSIKVWVAGCATGEEAWSIAILLDEVGLLDRTLLYATDISEAALATARRGVYANELVAGWAENHRASGGTRALSEHLHATWDYVAVDRRLQERVVFAEHSLATDDVFSEVHLVTCRNVLIYFDRELQERAVGLFRDALVRGGFLGLGSKESLRGSAHAEAFVPVELPQRLFRRV